MKLENKVAMITGGAQGIGEEMAVTFAKEGASLILVDLDEAKLEKTTARIKDLGRDVLPIRCDISSKADVDAMVAQAVDKFGRIDILVNNAAYIQYASFLEYDVEEWDKVMAVCLRGTFLCSQAVAKGMVEQRSGNIINIASVAGLIGVPMGSAYCTAKGGIISFTRLMAVELAGFGIRVNSISPGAVDTENLRKVVGDDGIEIRKAIVPIGRMGQVDDVAKAALFLASQEADFISGHNLVVDGAFMAAP
jgi:NAD(P)-dependent dehydrogenase (short-subunit alcohol dehydrogenase family)